jgi:hypothetical protein
MLVVTAMTAVDRSDSSDCSDSRDCSDCSDSHILLTDLTDILPQAVFSFLPVWVQYGAADVNTAVAHKVKWVNENWWL